MSNPKAAVEAWLIATNQSHRLKAMQQQGLKRKVFGSAPMETDVPRDTSVPQDAQSEPVEAPLLCFPLAAFTTYDPTLPSDFTTVERSGKALKSHVRPDGAVFIGLFEVQGERDTGVVVFGPEGTKQAVANQCSQQYRQELHALASGRRAALEKLTPQVTPLIS